MSDSLYEKFSEWIMSNYIIANGDMLTDKMEDGNVQEEFLRVHHLPEDTEIS
jgi:hypothetical protein